MTSGFCSRLSQFLAKPMYLSTLICQCLEKIFRLILLRGDVFLHGGSVWAIVFLMCH